MGWKDYRCEQGILCSPVFILNKNSRARLSERSCSLWPSSVSRGGALCPFHLVSPFLLLLVLGSSACVLTRSGDWLSPTVPNGAPSVRFVG